MTYWIIPWYLAVKDNAKKSAGEIKDALVELSDEWAEGLMNLTISPL